MKALIAEDSQIMRKIVKTNLTKLSVTKVYEAIDGDSAYSILTANPDIELLLTDYNMPGTNGIELCKKIRANEKLRGIRIVVISEFLDESIKDEFIKLGVIGFVPKPFDLKSFNEVVVPMVESIKSGAPVGGGVDISRDDFIRKIKEENPAVSLNTEELTINFNKLSIKVSLDKILEVGKIKSDEEKVDYVELKDKP